MIGLRGGLGYSSGLVSETARIPDDGDLASPTAFLLDDHELIREALRRLLGRAGMRVVGDTGSAIDALNRVPRLRPDVVVLESRLSDASGADVCRELGSAGIPCLILTAHDDDGALLAAIDAGVAGYLTKTIGSADLANKVRRVATGENLIGPALYDRVRSRRRNALAAATGDSRLPLADPLEVLSSQERKILTLLAEGLTNRQIAARLFLAEKTVRNYVSSLLAKLGFERRTQAAIFVSRVERRAG